MFKISHRAVNQTHIRHVYPFGLRIAQCHIVDYLEFMWICTYRQPIFNTRKETTTHGCADNLPETKLGDQKTLMRNGNSVCIHDCRTVIYFERINLLCVQVLGWGDPSLLSSAGATYWIRGQTSYCHNVTVKLSTEFPCGNNIMKNERVLCVALFTLDDPSTEHLLNKMQWCRRDTACAIPHLAKLCDKVCLFLRYASYRHQVDLLFHSK